jgi:hypothetical protein
MSDNNSIDRVKLQIDREQFRQVHILFYSATVIATISASITLLGVREIFIGNPQGTKTMLCGLHTSVNSIRLMRWTSDRIKNISDESTN